MAGGEKYRGEQSQQPQPKETGVSRRKFLGIEWNLRRPRTMKSPEPQGPIQETVGQAQTEPVMNRQEFVTGLFLLGAGGAEMIVGGLDNAMNSRQKAEQRSRAYKEV
jgi:hypothetical protein